MAKTTKTADPEEEISFEDAIAKIEAIVEEIEDDEIGLDVLIKKYEEGIKTLKVCDTQLEHARVRISQLEDKHRKDAEPTLAPFDGDTTES